MSWDYEIVHSSIKTTATTCDYFKKRARSPGYRNGAWAGLVSNMTAKYSNETYGRNRTKSNTASSALPGASTAIRSSSWKFPRLFSLVAFHQQMLLALLFIDICFRSLAHTVLYITEAWWHPKQILMRHSRSLHKRDISSAAIACLGCHTLRMMYYLANFHLQYWFFRPANCLQK